MKLKSNNQITHYVSKSAVRFNFTESFQLIMTGLFVISFLEVKLKVPYSMVWFETAFSVGGSLIDWLDG